MCLTLLFYHYRTERISNNGYIFHSFHFIQVIYVTVGYIFQTAAGLAQMVERLTVEQGGHELVSQGQKNTLGLKYPGNEGSSLPCKRLDLKVAQMTT